MKYQVLLATTSALSAVENEICSVSNFVKKTDYAAKVNEIEKKFTDRTYDKYITTPEFKKLTAENFAARLLAQANLAAKTDFNNKYQILIENLLQIKQKIWLLKSN